ncbi:zinc finger protein ZFP2 isoform X2 [Anabrus simplex]|uniref:zinc finger protein ZFP2 isoform X2 n=1 Tax=Anabrus simplex TaxID=316456 RepID=UPI0034DD5688
MELESDVRLLDDDEASFLEWETNSGMFPELLWKDDLVFKEEPPDILNTELLLEDDDVKPALDVDLSDFSKEVPPVVAKDKTRRKKKKNPKQNSTRSRENKVLVSRPANPGMIVRCDLCGITFSTRRSLLYHMKGHDVRPAHKCPVCSKEFGRKSALRVHTRIHSGHHPTYKCEVCLKTLKTSNGLAYHVRTHADLQLSRCYICGMMMAPESQVNKTQVQVCQPCLLKYR